MQYLDNCDIEWFALETNRDHSVVFEIASKYCILDSFVDHYGYSISSEQFLPAVGAQYATGDQRRNNSRKNEGMEPK